MTRGVKNVPQVWTGVRSAVRSAARSRWMPMAAALAVVLGTAGTYVSGNIAGAADTCDLRRELLLATGSPELRAGQAAMLNASEARTYLVLALGTQDLEQRREYAFLGLTSANNAISSTPAISSSSLKPFPFPTDQQLTSLRYMVALSDRVNALDIRQLVQTLKAHDDNFANELSELAECDRLADLGGLIGAAAVLLTLLSLTLIGFREYHQTRKTPRKPV